MENPVANVRATQSPEDERFRAESSGAENLDTGAIAGNELPINDHDQWLLNNKTYLQDYVRWVQLRLERYIANLPVVATPQPLLPQVETKKSLFNFGKEQQVISAPLPNAYDLDAINAELEKTANNLRAAESQEPPPAAIILSRQFGLSHFERDILMLCAALELDGKTASLCAKAALAARPYPTFALALQIFENAEWDALAAHRPLRYWRLLEINQPGAEPLVTSALRADERIVGYMVEPQNQLDDRLQAFTAPLPMVHSDNQLLAGSQRKQAQALTHYVDRQQAARATNICVQLTGPESTAKLAIMRHALAPLGIDLVQLALENLPNQPAELEQLLRLWGRERLLLPVALYLDTHHLDQAGEGINNQVLQRLATAGGLVIIASRDLRPELDGFGIEVNRPLPEEQLQAWKTLLADENLGEAEAGLAEQLPEQLAAQFSLDIGAIDNIAREALLLHKAATTENEPVTGEESTSDKPDDSPLSLKDRLWQACLAKTSPRLDQLAQRLQPKATWDQLVLPEESLKLLHHICEQVELRMQIYSDWGFAERMNRGMGLSVLFAGESGTGKTMAAEVLANALNLHLYRIDLSAVVSKYIGETEKNLRRLFDAAEDGGAILFFDEADALFGKRSEVKDSHDRYANIEINYLLQRIESYRGLAILATNLRSALDQAFMRRLRFILNFQFPAPAQRAEIWRKVFPAATPLGDLDYQHLSRFNLTGGSIHNIALNAAFMSAASADKKVTMPIVLEAIRGEMRKLDKPINEAEFRQLGLTGDKS